MNSNKHSLVRIRGRLNRPIFWAIVSVFVLLFVFIAYDLILSMIAVNTWVKNRNKEFSMEVAGLPDTISAFPVELIEINQRIAFTKSRLKMSATDSIGLSLNLSDSSLSLEISGVTVKSVRLREIKVSRSLSGLNHNSLSGLFSSPLRIHYSNSTIPREVIIDKAAPHESSSALPAVNIPDTSFKETVFFELFLENGIRILILQDDITTRSEKRIRSVFLLNRAFLQTEQRLKSVFRFKVPDYSPEVKITIPGSDARDIYRALPENGMVSMML